MVGYRGSTGSSGFLNNERVDSGEKYICQMRVNINRD